MNEESEIGPSIADIVQMRPWKHALLTTYTLSLSYFENGDSSGRCCVAAVPTSGSSPTRKVIVPRCWSAAPCVWDRNTG